MSLNLSPSRSAASLIARPSTWYAVILLSLVFWLSSSLLMDLVIMPELYATGMMTAPNFASAGYSLFGLFNRVEILCAALTLTGVLALYQLDAGNHGENRVGQKAIALSLALMGIALVATYWLTPEMSALGLSLNGFEAQESVPSAMTFMHGGYFTLECLKLLLGVSLVTACCRRFTAFDAV